MFEKDINSDSATGLLINDADKNGFVDESIHHRIINGDQVITITNAFGFPQKDRKKWSAIKAVRDDSEYQVLIEGSKGKRDGKFRVWRVDANGIILEQSEWRSSEKMMWGGYEEIFDLDLNEDSVTGLFIEDSDSNGLADGASYYKLINGDQVIGVINNQDRPQKDTAKRSIIEAIQNESGYQLLFGGTAGKKDGKFKVWTVDLEGIIQSQTPWKTGVWMANNEFEEIFAYDINGDSLIGA